MEKSLGRNSMDVEKFRDLSKRCHDVAVANQKKEQDYEDAPGITKKYPCITYLEMGHCTLGWPDFFEGACLTFFPLYSLNLK